jgi:hypothetical protein
MSLFSFNEICSGCKHAVFHICCGNFCRCEIDEEDSVNSINGTCPSKEQGK